ncbi:MAG: methyl-accepting chemotaxis protein [Burkholderiaceae bacterium]
MSEIDSPNPAAVPRARRLDPTRVTLAVAVLLTALVSIALAAILSARDQRDLRVARLEAVATAQAAGASARLGAQIQRLLLAAADVRMRQAAVMDSDGRQGAQRLLAEWIQRPVGEGGPGAMWLARAGDLGIIASAGAEPASEPSLESLRALTAGDGLWHVGAPSLDAARGRVEALAAAPVSIGPRVVAWLIARPGVALATVTELPPGARWRLLTGSDRSTPVGDLLDAVGPGAAQVASTTIALNGEQLMVAGARLPVGGADWVLAVLAPAQPASLPGTIGALTWRIGAAALMIACLAIVWHVRRTRRLPEVVGQRVVTALRAQANGDSAARATPRGGAAADDPEPLLDALIDERDRLREALARAHGSATAAIERLGDAIRAWCERPDPSRPLVDDDALTSPLVEAVNGALAQLARVGVDLREQASLVAQANSEIRAEADHAEAALGTQRRVVDDALADFERLRGLMGERAQASSGTHGLSADWRALRDAGDASLSGMAQAIEGAERLLRSTERRIKLFGERSQEIGEIVGILLTIAERTRVAALNASLQVTTAGAGGSVDGFPDEVRRLSDSAAESADQIRRQAEVIRRETAATSIAVNETIDELASMRGRVVSLAEHHRSVLGEGELAMRGVDDLDASAAEGLRLTDALLLRLRSLDEAADSGVRAMRRQHGQIERLAEGARTLLASLGRVRDPEDV